MSTIELAAAGNATSVTKDSTLKFTATLKDSNGDEITDFDGITINWAVAGKTDTDNTNIAVTDASKPNEATLTVGSSEEGEGDSSDGNKKKLTVTVTAGGVTQTAKVEVTS